jgi:hypothetical protein
MTSCILSKCRLRVIPIKLSDSCGQRSKEPLCVSDVGGNTAAVSQKDIYIFRQKKSHLSESYISKELKSELMDLVLDYQPVPVTDNASFSPMINFDPHILGAFGSFVTEPQIPEFDPKASPEPTEGQLEREASLLMFYLDHVFWTQFPFYCPSVSEGGRAWLLPLLSSSKPVYYATLSLAALHWRMSLREDRTLDLRRTLLADEKRHHTLALQELREHLNALHATGKPESNVKDCVDALACMIQLIFYEVGSRTFSLYSL